MRELTTSTDASHTESLRLRLDGAGIHAEFRARPGRVGSRARTVVLVPDDEYERAAALVSEIQRTPVLGSDRGSRIVRWGLVITALFGAAGVARACWLSR